MSQLSLGLSLGLSLRRYTSRTPRGWLGDLSYAGFYLMVFTLCAGCDITSIESISTYSVGQELLSESSKSPKRRVYTTFASSIPSERRASLQTQLDAQKQEAEHTILALLRPALRCDVKDLNRCAKWRELVSHYAYDLRQVTLHAPQTYLRAQAWLKRGVTLLRDASIQHQILGVHILYIGVSRLKLRSLPQRAELSREVLNLLESERDPLHKTRLLSLLHELTPRGEGSVFKRFTEPTVAAEVQESVWKILIQRHSIAEPLSIRQIKRSMNHIVSPRMHARLIQAAGLIKSPLVVRWCGKRWWETPLFTECRDALTHLHSKSATRALWRWSSALLKEADQTLNGDLELAESLSRLSYGVFGPRLKRRYLDLLDRFFSRRRAERAALHLAQSWLNLTPKRFATEICLRYLKPRKTHIVSQTQTFKTLLRTMIHQIDQRPL